MTDDDITPDRLRLAGWDDNRAQVFIRDGDQSVRVWFCGQCQRWHWHSGGGLADPTGMADIAARVAAAEAGAA